MLIRTSFIYHARSSYAAVKAKKKYSSSTERILCMTSQDCSIPLRRLSLPHRLFSVAVSHPTAVVPLPACERTSHSKLVSTMDMTGTQRKWQGKNRKEYMVMPGLQLPATLPELAVGRARRLIPVHGVPYSLQIASTWQKQTSILSSVLTVEFSLEVQGQKNSRQFLGRSGQLGKASVVVKVMLIGAK